MWDITIGLLLIIVGLWFYSRRKRFSFFKEMGIPGPEPNIFFGNIWEISKKSPLVCHKEWIEKYGKVLGFYFGGHPMMLVADTEMMKTILVKDFHKFMNRPQSLQFSTGSKKKETFSSGLTTLRDKRWKEIRRIISPSFTTVKMRMMSHSMSSAVDSLMEIMDKKSKAGKSFDIYEMYQGLTMDVIGRTAFGLQTDCQNNSNDIMLNASRSIFEQSLSSILILVILSFPELNGIWNYIKILRGRFRNKGRNPVEDLANIVKDVIKTRRNGPPSNRQDLLQIMIDAGVSEADLEKITNEQLTANDINTEDQIKPEIAEGSGMNIRHMLDSEIIDNSILFFLAGFETTSTALAFTTHLLLHHPEVQENIRAEIKDVLEQEEEINYNSVQKMHYLEQVFMESLRMYPPIYLFVNREASEDVQYGPYKIPKGVIIQIPVYSVNRDPDLWPEPDKFDPDRFSLENKVNHNSMAFQPFGAGPRNCVGMRFAQLEAKLTLARILQKYTLLQTEETDKDPLPLKVNIITMNPSNGVHLRAVPC